MGGHSGHGLGCLAAARLCVPIYTCWGAHRPRDRVGGAWGSCSPVVVSLHSRRYARLGKLAISGFFCFVLFFNLLPFDVTHWETCPKRVLGHQTGGLTQTAQACVTPSGVAVGPLSAWAKAGIPPQPPASLVTSDLQTAHRPGNSSAPSPPPKDFSP